MRLDSVSRVIEHSNKKSLLFDIGIALLLAALNVSIVLSLASRGVRWDPGVAIALVVVHAGCLAWRRTAPLIVMGVSMASALAVFVLGYPSVVLGPAILVAVYTAAVMRPRRWSLPATILVLVVAALLTGLFDEGGVDLGTVIGNVVTIASAWFLGDSIRQRRDYVHRLEERTAELEEARDELSRAAVVEERLRIARELHDILGHTLGAIAVQSGVGAHVIDSNPGAAKESLVRIESISKSSLKEIRQIVGALRESADGAEMDPLPGLDALPELVEGLGRGTVVVDLQVEADRNAIPQGLQLTAYRVVQEALTNVMRHSRASTARVSVRSYKKQLQVEVVDDGVGATSSSGGHGLAGMNERVSLHGGKLEYGPLPERGFRVSATLPLGVAS